MRTLTYHSNLAHLDDLRRVAVASRSPRTADAEQQPRRRRGRRRFSVATARTRNVARA